MECLSKSQQLEVFIFCLTRSKPFLRGSHIFFFMLLLPGFRFSNYPVNYSADGELDPGEPVTLPVDSAPWIFIFKEYS